MYDIIGGFTGLDAEELRQQLWRLQLNRAIHGEGQSLAEEMALEVLHDPRLLWRWTSLHNHP